MNYKIYDGYVHNLNPTHHDDREYTDIGQLEVYLFAQKTMQQNKLNSIIDIGCGSGYKLMNHFSEYETLGIETEPCFSMLKTKYPDRKWLLSGEAERNFLNNEFKTDLLICGDVIEHIIDPNLLIAFIKIIDFKYLVISTPDRDVLRNMHGYGERAYAGPPVNPAHVREWSFDEFERLLKDHFNVIVGLHGQNQLECMFFLCEKS